MAVATRSSCGGFTLLELLAVIGVISVLLGIGLGYLGKTDPELIARSILAGERRAAQMTARAEGVPTEVVVTPGVDAEAATVRSRLLEPVVAFHFEPGTPVLDERLRPELGGEEVVAGRFGFARQSGPEPRLPVLRWRVLQQIADLRDGFVMRIDMRLEERRGGIVLEIPPMLEVRLDDDLLPDARMRITSTGEDSQLVRAAGSVPLPLRRWAQLEVGCDGRSLWLSVDGRESGRSVAVGVPQQKPDMMLDVSPPETPVAGMVDELRILAFAFAPAQLLPIELQPKRVYRFTYDARGEPVLAPVIEYVDLEAGDG